MGAARAAAAAGAAAGGEPRPGALTGIRRTRLANGIRVVTDPMPEARSVSVGVWVGVGARDEPAELAGASHFLEHLLFKGTQTRSARDIAEAVDGVGGEMNAFTSVEYTAYYTRLPAARLALGVELLGDVLTAPAFRESEVEAERDVILEELLMDEDSPEDRVHTLLAEALFPGHPLGRETAGTEATIRAITAADIRSFFERHYRPATMVLSAAGRLDHDEVVALAERAFAAAEGGAPPERIAPQEAPKERVALRRATEQVHLALGVRGVARQDPDRPALELANQVLGGGMSSRLFQEVREARGLAYAVYSSTSAYSDTGMLTLYAGTSPRNVDDVLAVVDAELDRLRREGVTGAELELAKGCFEGSTLLSLEDSGSRMARVAKALTTTGSVLDVDEELHRYLCVGLGDVDRVLARVLATPRTLAVVGPTGRRPSRGKVA